MKKEVKAKVVYTDERGMIIKPGDICLARYHFPKSSRCFYAKVKQLRFRKDGKVEACFFGPKGWYSNPLKLADK